jgi:hypothetical protein
MTPEADMLLNIGAGKLIGEIAPSLPPGYAAGSTSTVGMVMILAAQEYGKGADTRIWENARMAELLAAHGVADDTKAASNTIADLNTANSALKTKLIALHAKIDGETDDAARKAGREILAFLKEAAARRRLYLPVL